MARMMRDRPILFKSVSSAVVAVVGDGVAQTVVPWYRARRHNDSASSAATAPPAAITVPSTPYVPTPSRGSSDSSDSSGADATRRSTSDGRPDQRGSAADLSADRQPAASPPYDVGRTVRMGIWRAVLFAPLAHGFYVLVDRVVPFGGWRGVAVKVLIDQLLYAAPMTFSFFFTDALLEGRSPREAWDRGAAIIWDVTKMTWSIWPFVQVFNFAVVPQQHRVVFVSVVATVWSVYLSLMNESSRASGAQRPAVQQ